MKKYLLGILAIVLAVSFSAFTKAPNTIYTFKYIGTSFTSTDFQTPSNWVYEAADPTVICGGDEVLSCQINLSATALNNLRVSSSDDHLQSAYIITLTSDFVSDVRKSGQSNVFSSQTKGEQE